MAGVEPDDSAAAELLCSQLGAALAADPELRVVDRSQLERVLAERAADDWTRTEFLVIAGDRDFGLPGAQRGSQALRAAGAASVRWSEYPDTEHLGVVQAALPEVFAFFDEIAAGITGQKTGSPPGR